MIDVYSYIKNHQESYYQKKRPIGFDFITAPHLTPLFGYFIALECLEAWKLSGSPLPVHVIECGPGDGKMMRDMVKIFKTDHTFWNSCQISFIDVHKNKNTFQSLEDIPDPDEGFFFVVGNEFLDALPIQHYLITNDGKYYTRYISSENETFSFYQDPSLSAYKIYETCPDTFPIMETLNRWLSRCKGLVLWIDYGDVIEENRFGDTLQAVYQNKKVSVFHLDADLSHHVDFASLRKLAKHPCMITTQARFLIERGLEFYMKDHYLSCLRLIHPKEMGELFKVFMMSHHDFWSFRDTKV